MKKVQNYFSLLKPFKSNVCWKFLNNHLEYAQTKTSTYTYISLSCTYPGFSTLLSFTTDFNFLFQKEEVGHFSSSRIGSYGMYTKPQSYIICTTYTLHDNVCIQIKFINVFRSSSHSLHHHIRNIIRFSCLFLNVLFLWFFYSRV